MTLSIIIIGDEILLGQVADTNSRAIARAFGACGWDIKAIRTVGDNADDIRKAVETSIEESDMVISTGGLGPTKDDITKRVLTEIFGGELREDPAVTENIIRVFELRGLKLNELTRAQALVPTSCRVINNSYGTAPCMWFERSEKAFAALPGVPFETEGIIADGELLDAVKAKFTPDLYFRHASVMVTGISESALAIKLEQFEDSLGEMLHLAYLPSQGLIRLRLDGKGRDKAVLDKAFDLKLAELKSTLGELMIFDGDASAAEILLDALRRRGLTMACAESCTGGNIAHSITRIAGCSDVFSGGVVSYSNDVKTAVLGVDPAIIAQEGAVSEPVVRQMALGVMKATGAEAAVATSGIAGPGGGSAEKPVGTVWMAAAYRKSPDGETVIETKCAHFPGKRDRVIDRATTEALLMLAKMLR